MKILSNDYESNIPRNNKISQGGTANFCSTLSDFLIKKGHEWIGLIMMISEKQNNKPILSWQENNKSFWKITISRSLVDRTRNSSQHLKFKKIFKKEIDLITDFIKTVNPDLIFLNGTYLNPWLILQASAKTKTPIIVKHAGIWRKELKSAHRVYTKNSLKAFMNLEKNFSKLSSVEIFITDWSRKIYQKEVYPVSNNKSAIIPLPIAINLKTKKEKNYEKPNKKIGIVARWDKIKNHKAVLNLAKKAKEKGLPWTFYSVTSIPNTKTNREFKNEYRKFIVVEPPKNKKELYEFYQKMDLTILPSHFETASYVVIESIFNGTPALISPNIGWVDDYRSCGATDWIVDFQNTDAVIDRIQKLGNRTLPKKLVSALHTKSNPKLCLKKYLSIFENAQNSIENNPKQKIIRLKS